MQSAGSIGYEDVSPGSEILPVCFMYYLYPDTYALILVPNMVTFAALNSMKHPFTIALVGNPNCGKSSLFNALTGLNQKVGNFPGVTVDKKTGSLRLRNNEVVHVIDLPGTYSLYPKSADEQVAYEVLLNQGSADKPDLVIVIADASNLKRNLLLCTQIMDLKTPVIIALTMLDIAKNKGIEIDIEGLERQLGVPVMAINPRRNKGIEELKKIITNIRQDKYSATTTDFIDIEALTGNWIDDIRIVTGAASNYGALHISCNYQELHFINAAQRIQTAAILGEAKFHKSKVQGEEILQRYRRIGDILHHCIVEESPLKKTIISDRIDKTLLHPIWGNLILLGVLFLLFQSIFWLSAYPMDWVEHGFSFLSGWLTDVMPDSFFRDLIVNGLLAGISGIAIFIPQIMILFGCITIL